MRRRTGRVLRLFQLLLSMVVLVTVPPVAMVAAYSVSANVPVDAAAGYVVDDLRRLLERV